MMTAITASTVSPSPTPHTQQVPMLDLQAQYAMLRDELRQAIERVMESQQFILGAEVQELEHEVASYSHAAHAVGCASGSDALLLALMALDIQAENEVITTPYTFFATASSITRLGARPVFVDIDPQTYNIDVRLIEAAVTPRTRAIMPVHLFGQCVEMNALRAISDQHNLPVVEDAAQAIGAEDQGCRVGSIGRVGCFSFFPSKNLGGAGDGGMLVTNDEQLAQRLRILRVHGGLTEYEHRAVGINSRLDALQAAVLRVKLPHLDFWSEQRRRNAERYTRLFTEAGLTDRLTLPFVRPNARHIFNQHVVRVRNAGDERDRLIEHLHASGVAAKIYYPVPLHLQECFRYLGYAAGDFPEAERAAKETLALPIYPELSYEQQQYVVTAIKNFYC